MAEERTDAELVRGIRGGDTGAFEGLHRRHAPAVRRVVGSMLRQPERVDDAVQEVFLKALERLSTLREPDRVGPWLKAIARNVANDQLRGRVELDLDDLVDDLLVANQASPDELGEIRELSRLVHGALAGLSERDTRAVVLAGYLDAGPAEIATALGISPGAAKVVLHRARRRLRQALKLELLVRRRGAACVEFRVLADADELVAAGRHLATCATCQEAGSREIGMYESDQASAGALLADVRGAGSDRTIVIAERLLIGRDCASVPADQRLVLVDEEVSRHHAEIRIRPDGGADIVDLSTNGTRLNGARLRRSEPARLGDGDVVTIGAVEILLRRPDAGADEYDEVDDVAVAPPTMRTTTGVATVLVVGDVIGFTAIAERNDSGVLATALAEVFDELRSLLRLAGGTLGNIAGDAILGVWELEYDDEAPARALSFAAAAAELVDRRSAPAGLHLPDGRLRFGWAVSTGPVSVGAIADAGTTVIGDATNVAFRLAGLAGRGELADVLVTSEVAAIVPDGGSFGSPVELSVRNREAPVRVVPLVR